MDQRFLLHNRHRTAPGRFAELDPNLRSLAGAPLRYRSPLIERLPYDTPGIYTIGGGRQVGKSTLVKQIMRHLLTERDVAPDRITYFTGEVFAGNADFRESLSEELATGPPRSIRYVFVDDATYIRDWDRAVKFLADAGVLERTFLLLTGSDLILMQDALKRLPGRRGRAEQVDYHYYPLSFAEFCRLRKNMPGGTLEELSSEPPRAPLPDVSEDDLETLEGEFVEYQLTGGYLTAINDLARDRVIARATRRVYSDWIRGDVLRQGKNETFLREVLRAIDRRTGSQITWNALTRELSIDHPSTVADYCALLERMDAVAIIPALREDRLSAAPKKARKLYFSDPFIRHSVREFLGIEAPSRREDLQSADLAGLVEGCFLSHFRRYAPTYYIKADGEVDVAYVHGNRFWPVEVKWSATVRPHEIKQVAKYDNGLIAGRVRRATTLAGVPVLPAPVVLLRAGGSSRW